MTAVVIIIAIYLAIHVTKVISTVTSNILCGTPHSQHFFSKEFLSGSRTDIILPNRYSSMEHRTIVGYRVTSGDCLSILAPENNTSIVALRFPVAMSTCLI